MNVAILAIGNEVLCGKIVDTNGALISKYLDALGATIVHRELVRDELEDVVDGLENAFARANIVITIGGLGPTIDDLTREGVAKFFNEDLIFDEDLWANIHARFKKNGRMLTENNKRQAYRFENGIVLPNGHGTAPGLYLKKDDKEIYLLPGPPHELIPMFDQFVLPEIKRKMDDPKIVRSYKFYGIGEAPLEEKLLPLYGQYPELSIAPYGSATHIDYLVSAKSTEVARLDAFEQALLTLAADYYVGPAENSLNVTVVKKLKEKKLTVAVAESCTGGLIASQIIDVPGASEVFLEGLVVYANESKVKRLGVCEATLKTKGAVSREVATQMAANLKKQTGAQVTIATTGIAGPGGGTAEKPVGLVYTAIIIGDEAHIFERHFNGTRELIRLRSAEFALYYLLKLLED